MAQCLCVWQLVECMEGVLSLPASLFSVFTAQDVHDINVDVMDGFLGRGGEGGGGNLFGAWGSKYFEVGG